MSENRKSQYKPVMAPDSQSQRRHKRVAELRSRKRIGVLNKRRRRNVDIDSAPVHGEEQFFIFTDEELNQVIKGFSGPIENMLPHLIALRKMLACEDHPVQQIIEAGIVPRLISFLDHNDDRYKLETVRCIANISSGDQHMTSHILDSSPTLISFLDAPNRDLKEEALYAIGNIAGDTQDCRDMLIAQGAIPALVNIITSPKELPIIPVALWALANLAKGSRSSALPFKKANCFPILVHMLQDPIMESVIESAWALTYLTAREDECVDDLIGLDIIPAAIDVLMRSSGQAPVCVPALRILGNIAAGPDSWLQHLLNQPNFLPILGQIISSRDPKHHSMVKEAAWVVSSLVGGHASCREAVITAGFLTPVLDLLLSDQFDLQREAAHAVFNISSDNNILIQLSNTPQVLSVFSNLLRVQDMSTVQIALSFLHSVCERVPGGPQLVEASGGLEAIDELHYGPVDPAISSEAAILVDRFFGDDYESGVDENSMTTLESAGTAELGGMGRGKHLTQPAWMLK